jgi:hypothetical protein
VTDREKQPRSQETEDALKVLQDNWGPVYDISEENGTWTAVARRDRSIVLTETSWARLRHEIRHDYFKFIDNG